MKTNIEFNLLIMRVDSAYERFIDRKLQALKVVDLSRDADAQYKARRDLLDALELKTELKLF